MLASAASFTAETILIKQLGGEWATPVMLFWRQAVGLLILLPFLLRRSNAAFGTPRPGLMLVRSVFGIAGLVLSYIAIQGLPLAEANALSFTRPLFLVVLAGLLLREKVTPARMAAAVVGFIGVLMIVRPDGLSSSATLAQMAALGAAILFALTILSVKAMARDHSPFTLMTYATLLGLVLIAPWAAVLWRWPSGQEALLLTALGAVSLLTQGCYIKGMQGGDASVMGLVDYTRIIFALAAGWLFFGDLPRLITLAGAGVIIGATVYVTRSEKTA